MLALRATPHLAFGHLHPASGHPSSGLRPPSPAGEGYDPYPPCGHQAHAKTRAGTAARPYRDPATWYHLIHHFVIFHLPYGLTLTLVYQGAGSPAFGHPSSGLRPPSPAGEGYGHYMPWGNVHQPCDFGDDQQSVSCIGGKWYNCDSAIIHS